MADYLVGVLGGGLVDPRAPLLRPDDLGVIRGDGCFETMRVAGPRAGHVDELDAHLGRLAGSAAAIGLPAPDLDAWRHLVAELLAGWQRPGEAALRLILTRGPESAPEPTTTGFGTLTPVRPAALRQRRDGLRVVTLNRGLSVRALADAPWLLGGAKTTSYAVNLAALRHAAQLGADDVIFRSVEGTVLEGPTSTVLWLADGVLHSPPPELLGLLPGITVQAIYRRAADHGFDTSITAGTLDDLRSADGIWLVSSVRLVAPVRSLDGVPCAPDPAVTARVLAAAIG